MRPGVPGIGFLVAPIYPKERERAISDAKAQLDAARREKEEESKKAEAAAKAMEAERVREQEELDKKAEEQRQEVNYDHRLHSFDRHRVLARMEAA